MMNTSPSTPQDTNHPFAQRSGPVIDVSTGEVKTCKEKGSLQSNAIGSCVVVTGYDRTTRVAGLAHVMLPGTAPEHKPPEAMKYAEDAIEQMVEKMIALGADRNRVESCIFGGANVLRKEGDTICEAIIDSVIQTLNEMGHPIRAAELHGNQRRTMLLSAADGRVYYTVGDSERKLLWQPEPASPDPGSRVVSGAKVPKIEE